MRIFDRSDSTVSTLVIAALVPKRYFIFRSIQCTQRVCTDKTIASLLDV